MHDVEGFLNASYRKEMVAFSIDEKHLLLLASIGVMIVPFSTIALMISRLAIYFSVFSIVAFPIMYNKIANRTFRGALVALFIASQIYSYCDFFTSQTYSIPYREFKRIFSVL